MDFKCLFYLACVMFRTASSARPRFRTFLNPGNSFFRDDTAKLRQTREKALEDQDSACAGRGLPEPGKPFRVIWDRWDFACPAHEKLSFSQYGMENNTFVYGPGRRLGKVLSVFSVPLNGIPQFLDPDNKNVDPNLRQSLESKIKDAMARTTDSEQYEGLCSISYADWRPLYKMNRGGKYNDRDLGLKQIGSRELVQKKHPDYNESMVEREARRQFDSSARHVFEMLLDRMKENWPRCHTGFSDYHWRNGYDVMTRRFADRLDWLWSKVTVFLPNVGGCEYVKPPKGTFMRTRATEVMNETLRIQRKYAKPNTPIYATAISENFRYKFLTRSDLETYVGIPAKMGADGVILWSSAYFYVTRNECHMVRDYVNNVVGPYVKNLIDLLADCSRRVCQGHGRCISNDLVPPLPSDVVSSHVLGDRFQGYHCRCYSPWSGARCTARLPPCKKNTTD